MNDEWMNLEHLWTHTDGKTKVFREKPVPLRLCLPQIPHGLARDKGIKPFINRVRVYRNGSKI